MKVFASHVKREGKMHTKRQLKAQKRFAACVCEDKVLHGFLRCCVQEMRAMMILNKNEIGFTLSTNVHNTM